MRLKNRHWVMIAFAIVFLDQLTKLLVIKNIPKTACIHIIPKVFDFVYVENTGAAFSIFSNSTAALGIVSLLFCTAAIIYWVVKKPQHTLLKTSIAMLFAGAFANAIDRIARGYVVDFIETAFMRFPVFNVADIAITIGAILLVIYLMFFDKDEKNNGKNNDSSAG